jgi:hypothetical protein
MRFLHEMMIASIWHKYREHLSRTARSTIITTILMTELALIGLMIHFLDLSES